MLNRGEIFRRFRLAWGLSTRAVEAKSRLLAQEWESPEYIFDASYLTKIENGERAVINLSMAKMVAAGEILSKGSPTLFNLCRPPRKVSLVEDPLGGPQQTQYVGEGRLAEAFKAMLLSTFPGETTPAMTQLVSLLDNSVPAAPQPFQDKKRYARAIVGQRDLCVFPMIVPGAFLIIDRELNTLPKECNYESELQRPIFLVETRGGLFCCWCDPIGDSDMVKIVQHPLGSLTNAELLKPLRLRREIEIIGVVAYTGFDRRPFLRS